MAAPIYTGDNAPLKFECWEGDTPKTPSSVAVIVYNKSMVVTASGSGGIDGNEVSFTVPTTGTTTPGEHHVFFICTIGGLERTHMMIFDVLPNPK